MSFIVDSSWFIVHCVFFCFPEIRTDTDRVVAVDLGINTTATVSVVTSNGTVMHREFIHPGRDIDRRDKRLKRISKKARRTLKGTKKAKLPQGFCRGNWRKATNINREIGQFVSTSLVRIAQRFGASVIVFEKLKNWRAIGGRRRSTLKQRFHGWLHRRIATLTEMKWSELGGKVAYVLPQYTSKYAYDGSGLVRRNSSNYALAVFQTGKQYNADLNGSLNIAARYWYKKRRSTGTSLQLKSRKDSEVFVSQSMPFSLMKGTANTRQFPGHSFFTLALTVKF